MAEWQSRPLDAVYPVVFVDAIHVRLRDGAVANRPIHVALAVTTEGRREILGCLGCDLLTGRRQLPGGVLHETAAWVVNHVVGPMNLGTLIVGPREHVVAIAELDEPAAAELGPLLRDTARVVERAQAPAHRGPAGDRRGAGPLRRVALRATPGPDAGGR